MAIILGRFTGDATASSYGEVVEIAGNWLSESKNLGSLQGGVSNLSGIQANL